MYNYRDSGTKRVAEGIWTKNQTLERVPYKYTITIWPTNTRTHEHIKRIHLPFAIPGQQKYLEIQRLRNKKSNKLPFFTHRGTNRLQELAHTYKHILSPLSLYLPTIHCNIFLSQILKIFHTTCLTPLLLTQTGSILLRYSTIISKSRLKCFSVSFCVWELEKL